MFGSAGTQAPIYPADGFKTVLKRLDSPLLDKCRTEFQSAACVAANNAFTDSRERTTIVNTPRIVPNGMKRHSMHAMTRANE